MPRLLLSQSECCTESWHRYVTMRRTSVLSGASFICGQCTRVWERVVTPSGTIWTRDYRWVLVDEPEPEP
jgi:hypothetical protein